MQSKKHEIISKEEFGKINIESPSNRSTYTLVKELLRKNKDKALTRKALSEEIFGKQAKKYWEVAYALTFLEQDGFLKKAGKNPVFYTWSGD